MAMGLVVDRVSDILTIPANLLQPVPEISMSSGMRYAEGIIAQPDGMICFLNLDTMFERAERHRKLNAAKARFGVLPLVQAA